MEVRILKNKEIIAKAAVQLGMYTDEEIEYMLLNDKEIPLHTLKGWNRYGSFKVKDGEEGMEVRLWRRKEDKKGFYKAKAYLYKREQLENIG